MQDTPRVISLEIENWFVNTMTSTLFWADEVPSAKCAAKSE